jgi:hypothetical protein
MRDITTLDKFPSVPQSVLSSGSSPNLSTPAPATPSSLVIGQSRSYPPPSPSSRVARSLGPPPSPRFSTGPGRVAAPDGVGPGHGEVQPQTTRRGKNQMQKEGLDRVNGAPLGSRSPLSPRDSYNGSPVVPKSSYLAVPLCLVPGYGWDASRTGGGVRRVVDDDHEGSASSNGSESGSGMGEGD